MKIFISTSTFAQFDKRPLEILKEQGFEAELNPFHRTMTPKEILTKASGANGLIAGTEKLDAQVLEQMKSLKVISRCGSGLDSVDLQATQRLGIKIYNTADAVVLPVVELTIGLMIALLRKIPLLDRKMHQGAWEKLMGNVLGGKRVGILGLGRIGRPLVNYLKIFQVELYYFDLVKQDNLEGITYLSLEQLLKTVDILTIHVPLTPETKNLLDAKKLSLMKKTSYLINCARGEVVDEGALYQRLKEGSLAGAALDVFKEEPYKGLLRELDNVILTPHIGTLTQESRKEMELESVKNLIRGFEEIKFKKEQLRR